MEAFYLLARFRFLVYNYCGKETPDLTRGGKGYYYLPVFADGMGVAADGSIASGGKDLGGFQVAERGECGVAGLRGADLGQDVRIGLDIELSRDAEGRTTEGGPVPAQPAGVPGRRHRRRGIGRVLGEARG
jgi:hypothetical protein